MSEKSVTQQQAGLVRRAKTGRRSSADLAGACSGGKFVVSMAGEAYDAQDRGPNRKFVMKMSNSFQRTWLLLLRQDVKFARFKVRWLERRNRTARKPIVASRGSIVSLTTHGKRINSVHLTLESIGNGSILPSRIILWLDNADAFNNLPHSLRRLEERGLEIKLTQNYGPHTKYYPFLESMDAFEMPFVTADDDVLYPKSWLSGLVDSFNKDSTVINCYRAHEMKMSDGTIAPYISWKTCRSGRPSFLNFATDSYGCIYPPLFLKELRAAGSKFRQLCPGADDVWLHVNAIRAGIKIMQIAQRSPKFPILSDTQYDALCYSNVDLGQNDIQIKNTYTPADIALLLSQSRERTQVSSA